MCIRDSLDLSLVYLSHLQCVFPEHLRFLGQPPAPVVENLEHPAGVLMEKTVLILLHFAPYLRQLRIIPVESKGFLHDLHRLMGGSGKPCVKSLDVYKRQ